MGRPAVVHRAGPRAPAEPADPHARRLAGRLRAHDPALVAAGARAWRSRASATGRSTSSPPTRTRSSTSSRRPPGRARRRSCRSSRSTGRSTCTRSSSASARAAPRARGRTSCTSARGCCGRRCRRTARSGRRREAEHALGVTHISSRAALRVSSQVIALDKLDPAGLDPRLGSIDADQLAQSDAVIVNIEYPLGLAAYNILREVSASTDVVRACTCSARRRR